MKPRATKRTAKTISTTRSANDILRSVYIDPANKGSFGGIKRLVQSAREVDKKIKEKDAIQFLRSFDSYTLHKSRVKRFPRQVTYAPSIDYQWQADLVIIPQLAKHNDGYNNLLTVIDVFSRYAFVEPLRVKTGKALIEAFDSILKRSKRKPKFLQTDKGTEFTNIEFQAYLKQKEIFFFASVSDTKAALCERFNRTLKERMWRYFSFAHTHRYVDILQDLVSSYNSSVHRSIGIAPALVNSRNEAAIRKKLSESVVYNKRSRPLYKAGDAVRIDRAKQIFEKGYEYNWSREIFYIDKVYDVYKPFMYRLRDDQNEIIEGRFYEQQLQPVLVSKETLYEVEKIVSKRKRADGKVEYLLKYLGYPHSANTWELADNVVDYMK